MNLKDVGSAALQVLKTVAPTIATAASGPFAPLVGPIMAEVFGTTDAKSTEAALLTATPDQLLALRKEEDAFQVQMEQLGITKDQLVYQDIASARNLEIQTRSTTPTVLSYGVLGASLFALLAVILGKVKLPSDPQTALLYGSAMTFMFQESKSVLTYWFGSTFGSQNKDQTIAEIAKS